VTRGDVQFGLWTVKSPRDACQRPRAATPTEEGIYLRITIPRDMPAVESISCVVSA